MEDYEFHADWDISTIFATSDVERSESEIKKFFWKDIELMIPPEYRDKIEYYCEYKEGTGLYYIAWLYPGKRLAQKEAKRAGGF
jgi:hypothetical protein